ncbi:helix-turn-helix transcriptional regulator [Lysinibacillus macroides]|uniref:HTH cro/C1-type domain-containing protein n=1 Tax=Lysinibacillus macroides TaxID=33935 RepID=A0A0M9DIS6_9BACI|nr:helix-turn-helix transcriptional regulator [Lysinibacillus macroides]KOY81276.1 hypothetical protein ADM90_19265 [Lysinibacillus macroides]QPR68563.1 helix-turn-helix transcriptional regulator [Lysinibacillus macroides]
MFAQNLAKLRKERNLSQYTLAELMNLSRGQIANYEQGSREPDFDTLEKFADFFGVSTDYLLGRTEKQNLTIEEQDEAAFQAFANNPTLQKWYKELPESKEEDLEKLRKMWEILKNTGEL